MSRVDPTDQEYYDTIDDNLNCGCGGGATGAYDIVATQAEYARFRRALMRWVEAADADWDRIACDEEQGIQP